MFRFITNKPLWVNILVGFLLALAIFSAFILSLGWFTHHGDAKTVPPVLGKTLPEAQQLLEKAGFTVEIQDSTYVDSLKPLQIIRQVPDEFEVVKSSRTVYLTINRAEPPLIEMPGVVGSSLRNAEVILKNNGLVLGDTTFRVDFAVNSVLEQLYNGATIQRGAKIRMGSKIDLVIGKGLGNVTAAVPNLIGMTYAEAKSLLQSKGLSFASIILNPDVKDSLGAFIYRQNPERFDDEGNMRTIRQGQTMDIWLSNDRPILKSPLSGSSSDSSGNKENQ